jgi:hypothetical protein
VVNNLQPLIGFKVKLSNFQCMCGTIKRKRSGAARTEMMVKKQPILENRTIRRKGWKQILLLIVSAYTERQK